MRALARMDGIVVFVAAAESSSFSTAAGRLHLSRSAVAKAIGRLEERLGTRLFHRTTRAVALTEAGSAFYERCRNILSALDAAEDALRVQHDEVVGRVRLTMPVLLGRHRIAPLLTGLARRHPHLLLELRFTDRRLDLIEEGCDLAIRSGPLPDSHAYKMRALGAEQLIVCAAPDYLAASGRPAPDGPLSGHAAIAYGHGGSHTAWQQPAGVVRVPVRVWIDDLEAMRDAAEAGLGLARLPGWLIEEAVAAGRLIELPEFGAAAVPVHAFWPQQAALPQRLRLVLDTLAAGLWAPAPG